MATAKDIVVKPIKSQIAVKFIRANHYSGKVDTRSQLHLGVFLDNDLHGVMQFGPSMAKHNTRHLFTDIGWNEFIELHRLAFDEYLPKNSESRAISIAIKLLKQHAPHVKVLISYADGTQCGDGTIYRASGFVLTGIKKNNTMWRMPDGEVVCNILFDPGFQPNSKENSMKAKYGKTGSEASVTFLKKVGAERLSGFQLRYIYFIDKSYRERLAVPELPFSEIERMGARMYKGQKLGGRCVIGNTFDDQSKDDVRVDPSAPINLHLDNIKKGKDD